MIKLHYALAAVLSLFISLRSANAQIITTVAGDDKSYGCINCLATNALLDNPKGIATDNLGNIYITTPVFNQVFKFNQVTDSVTLFAGTDSALGAYSGDGGQATAASLYTPVAVAADNSGNVYIVDNRNNVIRKVSSLGIITTYAGNDTAGFAGDGGPATAAELYGPGAVAVDKEDNVYISDYTNGRIRMVTTDGIITTVAGNGNVSSGFTGNGGPATAAALGGPTGLAVDKQGNIYVSSYSNVVCKISKATDTINIIAGTGMFGFIGDSGIATSAELFHPLCVAVDSFGNVYIGNYSPLVFMVDTLGIIDTFAGSSGGYAGDGGSATAAKISVPYGLAIDSSGNIYIADGGNNVIRKVSHSTTGISNVQNANNAINIYPNPVNEELYINSTQPVNVCITDITGRVLIETASSSVSMSRLAMGMYMVYVYNKEEVLVKVGKVVKE